MVLVMLTEDRLRKWQFGTAFSDPDSLKSSSAFWALCWLLGGPG